LLWFVKRLLDLSQVEAAFAHGQPGMTTELELHLRIITALLDSRCLASPL